MRSMLVVRFANGTWSHGGKEEDYAEFEGIEFYHVSDGNRSNKPWGPKEAKLKAQSIRKNKQRALNKA